MPRLMTSDKGIFIRNVFHMLSYAFGVLQQGNYARVAVEEFSNVRDLLAAILAIGVAQQLKQGMHREYVAQNACVSVLHGKLNMGATMRLRLQRSQQVACEYDEWSENSVVNRILKTTMLALLRDPTVRVESKKSLRKLVSAFAGVTEVEGSSIRWQTLCFNRSNRNYEMLVNICRFVFDDMLLTTESGPYKARVFSEERMSRLFEKFVLEYYRRHYAARYAGFEAKAARIKWDLPADTEDSLLDCLPVMQSDITLRYGLRTLVIDTKYYGKTMQSFHGKRSLISGHIYQLFCYVKNTAALGGSVSGVVLYAKTGEADTPNCSGVFGGNRLSFRTLDLGVGFPAICKQLDAIVQEHFPDLVDVPRG